ncbi:hypothetical protein B0H19DRAFT_97936 [Mycena capillaripes]|nr:hypothetical protein B0H19DRAFT_97936 [Mycena capillaripes]
MTINASFRPVSGKPQNVQEAVGAENSTPTGGAADPHISTFVICRPNASSNNRTAVTPEDIQVVENSFAEGGLVVSAHRPNQAEAWVEAHYDDEVFETIRSTGLKGPITTMLSPSEPALAVFGSFLDDRVLSFVRTLADVSGFAVMIRPIGDNPVPRFSGLDESEGPPAVSSTMDSESGDEEEEKKREMTEIPDSFKIQIQAQVVQLYVFAEGGEMRRMRRMVNLLGSARLIEQSLGWSYGLMKSTNIL